MNNKNNGGSAFPTVDEMTICAVFDEKGSVIGNKAVNVGCAGMTLRDYFAAKAMARFLELESSVDADGEIKWDPSFREIAECSYCVADAMLAKRDGGQ